MSTEKPFAEVVNTVENDDGAFVETGWQTVRIAGEDIELTDMADISESRRIAGHINAEVDRREQKLRGALMQVGKAIRSVIPSPELAPSWERLQQLIDDTLIGGGPDYVPGDVACGLAFDLGAAQAKTEGAWAVLADLAQQGGLAGERAAVLMEALGLNPGGPRVEHIFEVDYQMFTKGDQIHIRGRSLCGRRLDEGGDWDAVTLETHRRVGPSMRTCVDCGARASFRLAEEEAALRRYDVTYTTNTTEG